MNNAKKTFKLLFFIRKSKVLKNGEAPIYLRITVDGEVVELLIKRSVPVNLWNQSKECCKGKDRVAKFAEFNKCMFESTSTPTLPFGYQTLCGLIRTIKGKCAAQLTDFRRFR